MREIKFRLRNGNTVVGYCLWLIEEGGFGKWVYSPDNELWNIGYPEIPHKEKDGFTGLPDKQGKEIYEGDITCRHWGDGSWQNGQIIYEEGCFRWQEINKDRFIHPIGINTLHSEVIGNIHEKPELLGGKK